MRFLIFNLVVVGALFYLFAGGQPFADIDQDGMLGKVTAAVEKTVHSGREVTAAVVDKVMAENTGAPLPPSLTPPPAIEP
ncbi:MAG: hypothetical protein HN478_10150, partial [Rhodospirillaceae bacterium]|nr:hypothetical protein [Rhodospirillaceae bacterium]